MNRILDLELMIDVHRKKKELFQIYCPSQPLAPLYSQYMNASIMFAGLSEIRVMETTTHPAQRGQTNKSIASRMSY
jgi:hypothetical protein